MPSNTANYHRLYEIASVQGGFFTTKQAVQAGYGANSHAYHVSRGNWVREHRGIYRLANYPPGERPDLMLWRLWSCNRKEEPLGVYSHETALALHDLSDVNPRKLHMTVPKSFRRNSVIPKVLSLHFEDLADEEVEQVFGVAVTKPMRTITDVIRGGTLSDDLVKQAITEAMNHGLITRRQLRSAGERNESIRAFTIGISQ